MHKSSRTKGSLALVIIRNFRGHVLAARLQRYLGDIDAKCAETIIMKEGLLMAWELGFKSIILEGDAKEFHSNYETRNHDLSHTGIIMHDAIHIITWFSYFKTCYVLTHCNKVANYLASLAVHEKAKKVIGPSYNCTKAYMASKDPTLTPSLAWGCGSHSPV